MNTYNNCKECGKELTGNERRFPTCKDCYFKNKVPTESNEQPTKNSGNGFFDTKKLYQIPGWTLLAIFLLGVLIGAWLW